MTGTWATGGRTRHRPASQPRPCRARNVWPSPPCVTVPGETGSPSSPLGASAVAPQRPGTCRGSGPPARGVQGPAVDLRWARGPRRARPDPGLCMSQLQPGAGGGGASPANRQMWAVVEGGAALPGPASPLRDGPLCLCPPASPPHITCVTAAAERGPRALLLWSPPRRCGFGRLSRRRSPAREEIACSWIQRGNEGGDSDPRVQRKPHSSPALLCTE